jgi:tripartite-type tricarboxylate transporter receptor subunit TctC
MVGALVIAALLAIPAVSHAQYPSRPILLVVPYTAGSDADLPREVMARWSDVMAHLARDPGWRAGVEKLGGIPAVRSPAETDAFVRDQYQLYDSLAVRLGLRQ